jgi:hypothetical protein
VLLGALPGIIPFIYVLGFFYLILISLFYRVLPKKKLLIRILEDFGSF